jgi:hypothetical protein
MKTKLITSLIVLGITFGLPAKATQTVTVGATGTYPSISAAITGIGTITEPFLIELLADYAQTTDEVTVIAGANATNTVTIRPQVGVASLTVAGSAGYVWRMNGCQYVTIDGRAGGEGAVVLTLRADTTVAAPPTITTLNTALKKSIALQITNSSSNNVIQYVNFRAATNESFWNGQPTVAPTMGTITLGAGSTNITIDHCDIGPLHAYTGTPSVAIVSLGTLATPNSGIVISNNNIYDYFARDLNKCQTVPGMGVGVLIYDYNSNCTVSGNSFYQTLARSLYANQANAKTAAIAIQNVSGSGFIVKDNYIGGSQSQCGGSVYSNTIGNNTSFNAIHIGASNTGTSAVYGNTIKNLYIYAHSPIAQIYQSAGIYIGGGNVMVGVKEDGTTASANIIGDQSAAAVGQTSAAITFTGSSTNAAFSAILFNSLAGANVKISNNKIAGICVKAYATSRTSSFIGINILGTGASTTLIDNNEIGNNDIAVAPTSMSIQNYQGRGCFGIYMNSAGAATSVMTISNNKINNMYKPTEAIVTTNQTYVNGIWFNASAIAFPVTINNNEIRDLVFSCNRINDTQYYWSSGITFGGIAAGSVIKNNTIYNIEGQAANSSSVIGINLLPTANATTIDVYNNTIYNLSSDKTRKMSQYATGLTGIFCNNYNGAAISPTINVYNNMIRLGYNRAGSDLATISTIVGIRDSINTTGAAKANYYHNTIYIGGNNVVATDTVPTFGMSFATSATNAVVRNVKNNLIVNARSNETTGSGHYAIATGSANALTNFTATNNNYAVTGTGGVLGRFTDKTNAATLSAVQGYTGDANSKNVNPVFVNATGTVANLHLDPTNYPTNSYLNAGTPIEVITTDIDNDSRGGVPTMGADEFTGPGTLISNVINSEIKMYSRNQDLIILGATKGDIISIFNMNGQRVHRSISNANVYSTQLSKGIYIVNIISVKGTINQKTTVK